MDGSPNPPDRKTYYYEMAALVGITVVGLVMVWLGGPRWQAVGTVVAGGPWTVLVGWWLLNKIEGSVSNR